MKYTKSQVRYRLKKARADLNKKWLDECARLLTEAGVPQHVCLVNESVPDNSVPGRLKWFLLRRKNVQKFETDNLDKEMELEGLIKKYFIPDYSNSHAKDLDK